MDYYTIYIYVIFLIKIVFFILASTHLYLKIKNQNGSNLDKESLFWRERTEFIFVVCMSLLLIYYFRPGHMKPIDSETSLLFFLFGWILIITAKWSDFFASAKWYSNISGS